jgi:hypothetical protein
MDWAICHDNGRNACRHSVQKPVKSVLFRSLLGRMGWRSKSVSTLTILLLAATVTVLNGLDTPVGVAVDGSGNVFVADSGIRLICKGYLVDLIGIEPMTSSMPFRQRHATH